MLQRNTVFFSHPLLSPDLNRHDLTFYSPSFLGLWTWKLPFFPDMRISWSHDLITHRSALGKLLMLLPSNLPLLCQTADGSGGVCLAHTAAHLQKAKLMPLEHQFEHLYMVLFQLIQLQLDKKWFIQLDLSTAHVKSEMLYPLPTGNVICLKIVMSNLKNSDQ